MAKKKKRSSGLSGEEKQQRRRERLDARRQEKMEQEARRRRAERRERLVRVLMLGLLGAGLFWFLFLRGSGPSEINGHEVQKLSSTGSGDHTNNPVTYDTAPPVSGPHAPQASSCGTFAQPLPNEVQVHTLEHGAIGIQYQPTLDPAAIEEIERIVRSYDSHVFSAPYPAAEAPINLTAWGRLMTLEEVEEDSIKEFIDAFFRKGPERLECEMDAEDSFEPQAEPSPLPVETPEEGADPEADSAESPSN